MGRWAQAYFTSPPEKRDEAVHELLRQLEAEHSTHGPVPVADSSASAASSSNTSSAAVSLPATELAASPVSPASSLESQGQTTLVRCLACGRKNPSTQRFCGLCGTRLGEEGPVAAPHRDDLRDDLPSDEVQTVATSDPSNPRNDLRRRDIYAPSVYEPSGNTNDLSLFQSIGGAHYYDEDSEQIFSTPGGSGSYRTLAAIALLILVGTLGYLSWRNAHKSSQASRSTPPVSFATEEPARSEPVASSPSKNDAPHQAPTADNGGGPANAVDPAREKPRRAEPVRKATNNSARAANQAALRTIPKPEKNPQGDLLAGKGTEELAVAQRYLNGANGQGRNSAEGAKWLWRAVAKHNAEATFLLSDMYLKGEGVSKNCDQARVLLDTAALKGVKGAGERLRHLQAFGCQ
jgi:hypothetical protein